MEFSNELKKQIEEVFGDNEDLKQKLLALDPKAIQSLARMSQGLDPKTVIKNIESGNIQAIYDTAMKKVKTKDMYYKLCSIYLHNCANEARINKSKKISDEESMCK